jgi:hypothetical protein
MSTSLNFSQDGELFLDHSLSDSGHVDLDNFLSDQREGKSFGSGFVPARRKEQTLWVQVPPVSLGHPHGLDLIKCKNQQQF